MTYLDDKNLPPRGGKWHGAIEAWHAAVAFVSKALQCLGLDDDLRSDDDSQDIKVYRTRDRNAIGSLSTDPDVSDATVVGFQRQKAARHKQPLTCARMNCLEVSDLFSNDLSVILPDLNDSGTECVLQTTPEALIDFEVSGLFSEESDVLNQIPKLNDSEVDYTF
jgi:hypothetical protein